MPGLEQLIPLIYDAVDQPTGLSAVVPAIASWIGGPGTRAQMMVLEAGHVVANHHCGLDASRFEEYASQWMGLDPRMGAAMARPDAILRDTTDIDRAAFERSSIFNEALAPDDSTYALFGNFSAGGGLTLAQAFLRGRGGGPFELHEVERLRRLLPHLRCAARLGHVVGQLQDTQQDLLHALDALPNAVALIDRTERILSANASAERLLRDGGLRAPSGLRIASPVEARELSAAVGKTVLLAELARPSSHVHRPTPVHLSRPGGTGLWLLLYPLRPRNSLRQASARARVLAVFHDPGARVHLDPRLLIKIHGLTPTEAELASALAEGRTLSEFAQRRGCTEQTARTHLKRVLEKTATQRQAELVGSLLASACLHSLE